MISVQSGSSDLHVFAFAQTQGRRERQQDAFGQEEGAFFVIADGVGGAPFGEVAAQLAVEHGLLAFRTLHKKHFYQSAPEHLMIKIFPAVCRAVYRDAFGQYQSMGTTFAAALFTTQFFWIGGIGDSRIYHFTNNKLTQLTTDHRDTHGALTRWVGMGKHVQPDQRKGQWQTGDSMLLTTDGLLAGTTDEQLTKHLTALQLTEASFKAGVQQLVEQSLKRDDSDNITVCLVGKKPERKPIIYEDPFAKGIVFREPT